MSDHSHSFATCEVDGCVKAAVKRGLCGGHYMRQRRHGSVHSGRTADGAPLTFLEAALKSETDDCIEWPFGLTSTGYGKLTYNGRVRKAARLVLELRVGPAPSQMHVAAHAPVICHNPKCINHRHLRWATRTENQADKVLDGTDSRGEKHGQNKLSRAEVLNIRNSHESSEVLARRFKIHVETVRKIRRGAAWSWLT